jgi:hypothetical protein
VSKRQQRCDKLHLRKSHDCAQLLAINHLAQVKKKIMLNIGIVGCGKIADGHVEGD